MYFYNYILLAKSSYTLRKERGSIATSLGAPFQYIYTFFLTYNNEIGCRLTKNRLNLSHIIFHFGCIHDLLDYIKNANKWHSGFTFKIRHEYNLSHDIVFYGEPFMFYIEMVNRSHVRQRIVIHIGVVVSRFSQ